MRICWACLWASLSSERSYLRNSRSLLMAKEYWRSTADNSKMSLSWMASWNAAVRMWRLWLVGGRGRSLAVVEVEKVGGPSLLFRAAARLRTWLSGVQQIEQSCCAQGEVLVQVQGGSWRGVSVSVLALALVLALVLSLALALALALAVVGSILSLSRLDSLKC